MRQHIDTMGVLFMVYGVLQLVGVLVLGLMLVGGVGLAVVGVSSGEEELLLLGGVYGMIGLLAGALALVLAVGYLVAGQGLRKRRSWARIAAFVLGALALLNVPLGTALGVFAFIVLLDDEVAAEFALAG